MEYKEYFTEEVPLTLKPGEKIVNKYTVEIHLAMDNKEAYEVFKKYEASIHKKENKQRTDFTRFLCESPLYDPKDDVAKGKDPAKSQEECDKGREWKNEGVWPEHRGSYHMYHKINGELFGVGVVDITDICLSSVYFYYDPKYAFLSPGVVGAVREIEYTKMIELKHSDQF